MGEPHRPLAALLHVAAAADPQTRCRSAVDGLDATALYRAVNTVQPSLIRTEADETTYNLHIVLRFELELALIEGSLTVDDLPAAWDAGMERLLGLTVPGPADGVLQDVHWSAGMLGYFPTYTIGNLMAAQLWERLQDDMADLDALIEQGDFAPLREWLRVNVHSPRPQVPAARAAAPDHRRRAARRAVPALPAREARRLRRASSPPSEQVLPQTGTCSPSREQVFVFPAAAPPRISAVLCPVLTLSSSPAPASTT